MAGDFKPVPTSDDAQQAIADGNAAVLATYLRATPNPDRALIVAIANMLDPGMATDLSLEFKRPAKRPAQDWLERFLADHAIYDAVKATGLSRIDAFAEVSIETDLSDSKVQKSYDRINRLKRAQKLAK